MPNHSDAEIARRCRIDFFKVAIICPLSASVLSAPSLAQGTKMQAEPNTDLGSAHSGVILAIAAIVVIVVYFFRKRDQKRWQKILKSRRRPIVVRTYRGSQSSSYAAFQNEARAMAGYNYFPTSQSWIPGQWGAGSFIAALLLCLIFIGILIFIYMLIVKPSGLLTVTYELRAAAPAEKTCPQCAESVKAAALVFRPRSVLRCKPGHALTLDQSLRDPSFGVNGLTPSAPCAKDLAAVPEERPVSAHLAFVHLVQSQSNDAGIVVLPCVHNEIPSGRSLEGPFELSMVALQERAAVVSPVFCSAVCPGRSGIQFSTMILGLARRDFLASSHRSSTAATQARLPRIPL